MLSMCNKIMAIVLVSIILCSTSLFAVNIKLPNGSYVQGEIVSHDDAGFVFKKWGSGGVIRFKWSQLSPEEAERLRGLLDIKILGKEVAALEVYLKDGKVITGIKIDEDDRFINIKTLRGVKQILKETIWISKSVKVDIMDVYTQDEAYDMEAKKYDLTKAEDNFKLAKYCLDCLGLYDKARELFTKSADLDKRYKEKSERQLKEINKVYLSAEIKKIDDMLKRGYHKKARVILDSLKEQPFFKGDSSSQAMIQDAEQRIAEVEKKVSDDVSKEFAKEVVDEWFDVLGSSITKIVSNKSLSYSTVTEYVNRYLIGEVNAEVARKLKMEEEDVKKIFNSRTEDVSSKQTAVYGDGSFIVAGPLSAPSPGNIEEYSKYKEKVQKISDAKNHPSAKKIMLTSNSWWDKASNAAKKNWLLAYFGERHLKVLEIKKTSCRMCRGEGVLKKSELCSRCQGKTVDISVEYY